MKETLERSRIMQEEEQRLITTHAYHMVSLSLHYYSLEKGEKKSSANHYRNDRYYKPIVIIILEDYIDKLSFWFIYIS